MSPRALCVVCHTREVETRYRPFCSERCQMVDLGRWLGGSYRVAGEPLTPDEASGDEDADTPTSPDR